MTQAEFYGSSNWKKFREYYKKSVGGLCEMCAANGLIVPGEIVHHKIELTEENVDDANVSLNPDNMMLVCFDCHNKIHFRNEKRYSIGQDGNVIAREPQPRKRRFYKSKKRVRDEG